MAPIRDAKGRFVKSSVITPAGTSLNVDDFDLAQFNKEVNDFVRDLTQVHFAKFHRRVALEALRRIVLKTPVDTGRARGNWQTTINVVPTRELRVDDPIAAGAAATRGLRPFVVINITNNVPYIETLEYGRFNPPNPGPSSDPRPDRHGKILVRDGYSTQAPQGMVRLSLLEIQQMFP